MKLALTLSAMVVTGCVNRAPVTITHNGTTIQVGQKVAFGGKTYDNIKVGPDGTLSITTRDNMEKSWADTMLAAGAVAGAYYGAAADKVRSANRTAASIAAGRQATAQRAIEAREAVLLGEQATTRFLNPPGIAP